MVLIEGHLFSEWWSKFASLSNLFPIRLEYFFQDAELFFVNGLAYLTHRCRANRPAVFFCGLCPISRGRPKQFYVFDEPSYFRFRSIVGVS